MSDLEAELASSAEDFQQDELELDTITAKIVQRAVRTILHLNNTNTPISKANLQKYAWDNVSLAKVSFNLVIGEAQQILIDTFGYSLKVLPTKETFVNGKKKSSKAQQWILVNTLDDAFLKFMQESNWLPNTKQLFESELNEERHDYRNNKELFPVLTTDEELVLSGLALTVVSLIIVSNNHMNENELLGILVESFGLDVNREIEVLKLLPRDMLKVLDKYEYVNRSQIRGADGEEIAEYSVGRRGKAEFTREDFTQFVKIIYDEREERAEFMELVKQTLEPTYGGRE